MKVHRSCFACARPLLGALGGNLAQDFMEPPGRAVVFTGAGNYGSAVWAPDHRLEFLEISVCDECLRKGSQRVLCCRTDSTNRVASATEFTTKESA